MALPDSVRSDMKFGISIGIHGTLHADLLVHKTLGCCFVQQVDRTDEKRYVTDVDKKGVPSVEFLARIMLQAFGPSGADFRSTARNLT